MKSLIEDISWFIRYKIIEWFLDIPRKIRCWKLKRKRGWSKYDTWELKWTLSSVLASALKAFKEDVNSYPPELTFDGWKSILQEMIDGFTIAVNEEDDWTNDDFEDKSNRVHNALKLFEKYFDHLWW